VREIGMWNKFLITLQLLILTACSGLPSLVFGVEDADPDPNQILTIFAAASLIESFNEIGERYEAENPGTQIILNYAGSQQLAQQLSQGAPADVYASADRDQMENVIHSGRVQQGMELEFTRNRLAVILPEDNPGEIEDIRDLANPDLQIVLADDAVPVGQYSLQMLEKVDRSGVYGAGFKEHVINNVVSYEENVRAVLSKILLGEADAGIVYSSDVLESDARLILVPDNLNVIASYYISPINDSSNQGLARDFIEFIFSPDGQEILASHGFNQRGQDD
jgi:molybdate transport system substrate-binding protein